MNREINDWVEDFTIAKVVMFCVGLILLCLALYTHSVNKDDATKYRLLVAKQNSCTGFTGSSCYIRVLSASDVHLLKEAKKKAMVNYGVHD